MQPSKYDSFPWSYKGPPEKKQPISTGGRIKHKDGTIERYYGDVPSRYSRKGKTRQDETATSHDPMFLDRSAAASTSGQTVTPSFHSSTPTLVNDTERGGREATTGIAMSEQQGESGRKPKEQPGTTATGTSRGVGSMFSKAKSLLGDK